LKARNKKPASTARRNGGGGSLDQVLIEAALGIFAAYGYRGASLSKIASAARVTKGALYWHFTGKEDFFIAVIHRVVDQLTQAVRRKITATTVEQFESEFVDVLVTWARETERRPWVLRVPLITALQAQPGAPRVAKMLRDLTRDGLDWFARIIEQGKKLGVFRADLDSSFAATEIYVNFLGSVVLEHLDRERLDLQSHANLIAKSFLANWGARPSKGARPRRRSRLAQRSRGAIARNERNGLEATTR